MDDKSSLKGAWFGSCDHFACATVDLKTPPRHAINWDNNVVDDWHLDGTVEAIQGLSPKLH